MATGAVAWFRSPSSDWRGFFAAGPGLVAAMAPEDLGQPRGR
jgi:hypothetical protein